MSTEIERPVVFLDYHPQTELDVGLATDLRNRLLKAGYRPVSEVHPEAIASQSLDPAMPQPVAAIRILSASALTAGFVVRGFDDLPVFTIGIRDGQPSPEPFAANAVWTPSIRSEGVETDWEYVLRAALEFVEKATASFRGVSKQGIGRDSETALDPGTAPASAEPQLPPPIHDPTPLHLDTPATVDHLNRRGFARALAVRLERIWREMNPKGKTKANPKRHAPQGSFVLHLHGEWGSGKSSLLEMLRRGLQPRKGAQGPAVAMPWVVVDFNAWQNQRLDPPWWPLLDGIYRQSLGQIPWWRTIWCWLKERIWRFTTKRRDIVIFAVLLLICAFLGYPFLRPALIAMIEKGVGEAGDTAAHIVDISTLLTLIGSGLWLGSRSLVSGTARAAQSFVESVADPMDRIQRHFTKMVGAIDRPIAVFVDDLDRCQAGYVVQLLEGIQTLFRDPRVVYVVAADQRWLHTCFEQIYEPFADSVRGPGRRLGSLFLEKAFEISVEVPRLSKSVQAEYWRFLLAGDPSRTEERIAQLEREARTEFASAASEQQVISRLEKPASDSRPDPVRENVRRQVAVERLANAEVEQSVTYFLQPFAPLLEPNPRSMKRFLNTYAIQRDLAILAGQDVLAEERRRKKLALWTVLSLRWPGLGEQLISEADDAQSDEVRALRATDEVREIVTYLGPDDPLTLDDVAGLLGLTVPALLSPNRP
ncbi:MAG TPA: P-loop NTPase fold protein [Thermoanaerobaculia bacterium]|nr:P-loop NTPase fold protein [Thermoanaerobaculia bacterium]